MGLLLLAFFFFTSARKSKSRRPRDGRKTGLSEVYAVRCLKTYSKFVRLTVLPLTVSYFGILDLLPFSPMVSPTSSVLSTASREKLKRSSRFRILFVAVSEALKVSSSATVSTAEEASILGTPRVTAVLRKTLNSCFEMTKPSSGKDSSFMVAN
uniref:Secreted protein n=1 Tax=Ditylenchus dipsaci TaxID=166011 RepID=A0A915E412_9BILA